MKLHKKLAACASALVLCASSILPGFGAMQVGAVDDTNDDWLHAVGSRLYDSQGNEVWLTGANWFGFNCSENCVHYLWSADVDDVLSSIADHGINVIRFPISTELLLSWMNGTPNPVSSVSANKDPAYTINPDFCEDDGKTLKNSMEIFDIIMQKCKKYGLKAFVDIHSPHADNSGHNYNLWYGKETADGVMVTTDIWIDTLTWLAKKYSNDDTIIGYDLKNEPHGKGQEGATAAKWDDSEDENNWAYAATRCANSILSVNPNALIFVEGVEQSLKRPGTSDYWGMPDSLTDSPYIPAWWGGNLRGVRDYPIVPDSGTSQIVYSPHDYGPSVYNQTWFDKEFTTETLLDDYWYDTWAYVNAEDIAPLLIGEWGGHMDGEENQKWMTLLRDYMIEHHINHTFWCLNTNSGDTGGLWSGLGFSAGGGSTIEWDEEKYGLMEEALWQTSESGLYVGLDHETPLGLHGTGLSLNEYYASYADSEGSNLNAGGKTDPVEPATTPSTEATEAPTEEVPTEGEVPTTEAETPAETETSAETQVPPETVVPTEEVPSDLIYGDVDGDEVVKLEDVIALNKYLMGIGEELDDVAWKRADVDQDGKLGSSDSLQILRYVVEILDKLPV